MRKFKFGSFYKTAFPFVLCFVFLGLGMLAGDPPPTFYEIGTLFGIGLIMVELRNW